MSVTIRARSLPYRTPPTAKDRICKRCGIQFRVHQPARDPHIVTCRDCRGIK